MFISKDICPVPFDQQPLNEYYSLKDSCFFSWSTLPMRNYIYALLTIAIALSILLCPIVLSIIPLKSSVFKFLISDIAVVSFCIVFILVRLYLGWSYVTKRLLSATIFYEESGWYDGQLWIKTAEILTKDRLVGMYQVVPCLQRIQYTLGFSIFIIICELIIYYLL